MKTIQPPKPVTLRNRTIATALCALSATLGTRLPAQAPCAGVETLATGLLGPAKIIQTPRGNFLVAEVGPEEPNNGRVSIVDRHGNRRTLIDGLPSARTFVGDFNGTTGLCLEGRTLFVLNGQGDVTLAGPVPGTEIGNPAPSSPIFSSILAVTFGTAMEETTTGVRLSLADHHALSQGATLVLQDDRRRKMAVRLVADFPDYLAEPRPNFAANVRHSHPYGIVAQCRLLHVADAGFNRIRTVDLETGAEQTLVSFPPTPSPLPAGPPVIENVPTSLRLDGHDLLVTLLSGAPAFLPGYSQVQVVSPFDGSAAPLITGLSSAIDVAPLGRRRCDAGYLTLEVNLTFPVPGPGRLQYFPAAGGSGITLSECLAMPSSMVIDRRSDRVVIAEMATGSLVTLELP